jgi:hypothetical protein
MKKEIFTAIAISGLIVALLTTVYSHIVLADLADPIQFLDSGITVYSPLNMTYQAQPSILKVSLYGAGNFGSLDPEISMNYSIDNVYNGAVYLRSNGEMHFITNADGTAALPELPSGSHCLRIYLYGWNQRSYEPRYLSYVNTVYFSIAGASFTSSPTTNPTTPTPTTAPTPTSTSSPEPTPETETFPGAPVSVASLGIAVVVIGFVVYFKKHRATPD